ncbi:MAG: NAD-dependent epimerase/dehydratase family protein [Fidelibacterota bacterium]|nr:MAG: NAD-dependent epimerase/dehydratase family protein [Candidatus Neomarinimicrobiota bacterium]
MSLKTVLLTGGCGFLGQHLIRDLLQEFPEVCLRIIDLQSNPFALFDFSSDNRVEVCLGLDICDMQAIQDAFQGMEVVVHLAGLVSPSLKDEAALKRVNVQGTRNVVQASREHDVSLFIHISSVAGLGYNNDPLCPADETFRFDWAIARRKNKYYMLTKHLADQEVEICRRDGLAAVILYPGLMFGPGDYRNTANMIRAVDQGKIPVIPPGGTNVADVRDVARGIVAVLKHDLRDGNFLLSGWNLTFKEIFYTIAGETNGKAPRLILPRALRPLLYWVLRAGESITGSRLELSASELDSSFHYRYFDHSRAKSSFGWSPAISFEQTIADAYAWMRENDLA